MSGQCERCRLHLRSKCDASGLDLDIAAGVPFADSYPEFPAQGWTCPHGARFWTQPTATEAARLRALNGVN